MRQSRRTYTETVPLDAENEVEVEFRWTPGTSEYIPPYNRPELYDPGSGDEFEIVRIWWPVGVLSKDERVSFTPDHAVHARLVDETLTDWLDENWKRPDDSPDPDYLRDMRRDEDLTR